MPDVYPPAEHMVRDLQLAWTIEGAESRVSLPIVPAVCGEDGGVRVGLLATLVDAAAGGVAGRAVHPHRIATTDLVLHRLRSARGARVRAQGNVLRRGRTNVALEVRVEVLADAEGPATEVARATASFALLRARSEGDVSLIPRLPVERSFATPGSGLRVPFLERAGVRVLDPKAGAVEVDVAPYVRNSFGMLNGGMAAILVDLAGELAARGATGSPMVTTDLLVRYLSFGRVGPVRSRTEVLRRDATGALVRVELLDTGAGDALVSVGSVAAAAPQPGQ